MSELPKTLMFCSNGIQEYDDSNDKSVGLDIIPNMDHQYLGNASRIKKVKKRLILDDSKSNRNSIKKSRSKKVKKYIPRNEGSLFQLTKKFANILLAQPDSSINLNSVCNELSVPKRRLYDITNVLEGVGLLHRPSRNLVQWEGNSDISVIDLQTDVHNLEIKENMLDDVIKSAELALASMKEENKKYAYASYEDLKALNIFKDKTAIGIQADSEAKLCTPESYKLYIKSQVDPISGCLIDDNGLTLLDNKTCNTDTVKIANNKVCYEDNSMRKKALLSDYDDLSLGKNILLQTEDQLLGTSLYETLDVDYNLMLDKEEGLIDLFDPSDLSNL